MESSKLLRILMAVSTAILAVVIMVWVQSKFDGADRKAALEIVQTYQRGAILNALDKRHPGKAPMWTVETQSACMQHERVRVAMGDELYEFMVDINRRSIHPGNRAGEEVLGDLDVPVHDGPRPEGSGAP